MKNHTRKITRRRAIQFTVTNVAVVTALHWLLPFLSGREYALCVVAILSACYGLYKFADPIE